MANRELGPNRSSCTAVAERSTFNQPGLACRTKRAAPQEGRTDLSSVHELALFDVQHDSRQAVINHGAFAAATDHRLDATASITHVPQFLLGHDILMQQLSLLQGWEQRRRWMYNRKVDEPRLTHEYRELTAAPPLLTEIAGVLSDYCNVPYDGIWMNWYRDNRDSTAWHADRPANLPVTAVVPVLSLGATRRFLIRPNGGGRSTVFVPAGGDLIIMRGRCQRDWQHCVPKQQAPTGPRMSLNYTSAAQAIT
ncbi:MAG TPA: alpha-ketoglutarate-dependent dioxygenase AlkB [Mycobacterium sp.]|uniref:alpha-ketoglutarate-dependent dioxygenase AlkB n=1 Tax=Mycobacterium sp. TaxID=1785 RepID=UPI002F3FEEFF